MLSNKSWFKLHGWCSLPVWLIFCFVCLTGTIAVLSHELTWLTNPAARASNPQDKPALPISQLVAAVQQKFPTADVSNVMTFEPYLVHAIAFTDHDKPYAIAYVNQYTGDIQEINEGLTFIGFMRSLHGWLLFPWQQGYSVGYYLVSAMAFVMLGALITGLMVYKKFWRSFTQPKVRLTDNKATVLADLHRLAGVWSIWFLMLMSATGFWYLAQAIMWHNEIDIEPHAPIVDISEVPAAINEVPANSQSPKLSLADAMEIATKRFPQLQPSFIMLPEHQRGMYQISGGGDHIFYDQYAYALSINPWTGIIASEKSPETLTAVQTLLHIADPLHYGTIGGLWTKFLWFFFGVVLTGMSITGFMMWATRLKKAMRDDVVAQAA